MINVKDFPGIQAAFDALPPDGGTIYFPAGTYTVDKPIVKKLAKKQHLTVLGEGRASVLVNENKEGAGLLEITGVDKMAVWYDLNVTVRDLMFVGNHESGNGIQVQFAHDLMIDACFFLSHGGKAVYLKSNGSNATVRDCWMRDCKWGIYAENTHHLTAHGNQMRRLNDGQEQNAFIYLDRNCREIRITANHLAYGASEGIILDGTAQHAIVGNTIEGFTKGIDAISCRDIVITGNYLRCPHGIRMSRNCDGFVISGNLIHASSELGILIEDSLDHGGHSITGNVFRTSVYKDQGGIILGNSSGCVVTGNMLEKITKSAGISASAGGGSHLISGNTVRQGNFSGIEVNSANGNVIADNICSENAGHGISLCNSSDNVVVNNRCAGNDRDKTGKYEDIHVEGGGQ